MTARFRNISTIFSLPTNRNLFARAHGIIGTPRNSGAFGFPFLAATIASGLSNTIGGGMSEKEPIMIRAVRKVLNIPKARIGREFSQSDLGDVYTGILDLVFLAADMAEELDRYEKVFGKLPDDTGTIS